MKNSLLKLLSSVLCLAVSLFLVSGCAYLKFFEDEEPEAEPVECTEEPIDICVKIVDKRWCKEGGYGMPKVSIYLKKDLALILKEPVIAAFECNNLFNSECGVPIEIEVEQFFCDVVEHRCTWNCVSELIFHLKVLACNGETFFSKRISGIAENDFEMTERNGKARKALETALDDAMCGILEDKSFRRAVLKASLLYK